MAPAKHRGTKKRFDTIQSMSLIIRDPFVSRMNFRLDIPICSEYPDGIVDYPGKMSRGANKACFPGLCPETLSECQSY